jgi:chorismate mutase
MNDAASPPGTADPADQVRREIDGVDAAMLSLLAERLKLAETLSQAKTPASVLPIHPGQEVSLLRKLVETAPAPLDRETVVEFWRALIAAALRRQKVIDVVVGGARGDPTRLFDIARRHFGARTRIQHVGEAQDALLRVAEAPDHCVAVTPWPAAPGVGSWWPALTERRFHDLHLIAGLPVLGAAGDPEACVFAHAANEAAGGDVSLLLAFDPHHRAQRALNEAGLNGKEIARSEPRVLLRIEDFIAVDDPRAAALSKSGLDGVRLLGSYARV